MTDNDMAVLSAALDAEPIAPATINVATPRKCYRHEWAFVTTDVSLNAEGGATLLGYWHCSRCGKPKDAAIVRRNRTARNRGNRTSHDLAAYLGIQNVEALKLPHDVQANHLRMQSKRQAVPLGPVAQLRLLEYIPSGDWLRALFIVAPRARLANGSVTVLLEEWTAERGWTLPEHARLAVAGVTALLSIPLPVFADVYGVGK